MKKSLLIIFLLCITNIIAQETQNIDVSSNAIKTKQIPIKAGKYIFNMTHINKTATYDIKVEKKDLEIKKLVTPNDFASLSSDEEEIGIFIIDDGQELTITINVTEIDSSKNRIYLYKYQTPKRGEWRTTFGFNFIYLINNDTYYSNANNDDTYTITEGNNKDIFNYYPTLMFTWIGKNYLDPEKRNWKTGLSGGIGYDFKTSLSVFTGISLIYNENITITTGLAFHNQKRLSSNYSEGDILRENLTFEQLHSDYIRVNPFISISFRLDKNPFK